MTLSTLAIGTALVVGIGAGHSTPVAHAHPVHASEEGDGLHGQESLNGANTRAGVTPFGSIGLDLQDGHGHSERRPRRMGFAPPGPSPDAVAHGRIVRGKLILRTMPARWRPKAKATWGRFAELIPPKRRRTIKEFELVRAKGFVAAVEAVGRGNGHWKLSVAVGKVPELDESLVHEFAHVMTLGPGQVRSRVPAAKCRTYYTLEGCATPRSTLNRFVKRFWPKELRDERKRLGGPLSERASRTLDRRYPDTFVNPYAATEPEEDLAESFVYFVRDEKPEGDRVVDQKLLFFWARPDMVRLRTAIRKRS